MKLVSEMIESATNTILDLIRECERPSAVRTDRSVLMVYPPNRELDVRVAMRDRLFPVIKNHGLAYRELNLQWVLFNYFDADEFQSMEADEFFDPRIVRQDIASRVESRLGKDIEDLCSASGQSPMFITSTMSLFPFIRFGELLRNLRHLESALFVLFPGEEHGGKLHFMNEPDGGNYLATKVSLF